MHRTSTSYAMRVLRVAFLVASSGAVLVGCLPRSTNAVAGETRTFDGMEFQWCPPGTFMMGSPDLEAGRSSDEPQHQVTISQGFWLGKHEVTQEVWEGVMGTNPSAHGGADRPVERVSWVDVQAFLDALNIGIGDGPVYRLPTEAEWEYACRAGTTTRFYWGDDPNETAIADYAWYSGNGNFETHNVGEKMPNPWGLQDMSGNVFEWCQDWYGDYPAGPVTDPQGPASGSFLVMRGGSFTVDPAYCRAAERNFNAPSGQGTDIGLRLLRTAD